MAQKDDELRSRLQVQILAQQMGFAPLDPLSAEEIFGLISPANRWLIEYGRTLEIVRDTPEYQEIIARRRRGEITPREAFDEIHVLTDAVTEKKHDNETSLGGLD